MKTYKATLYFLLLLFLISCNSKDKVVGEWERYGDSKSGTLVKIESFGNSYQGLILNLVVDDEINGWQVGDVCWKNISYVEKNKYQGIGMSKGYYGILEHELVFVIENENTLLVKDFVTDNRLKDKGIQRRYKRIRYTHHNEKDN